MKQKLELKDIDDRYWLVLFGLLETSEIVFPGNPTWIEWDSNLQIKAFEIAYDILIDGANEAIQKRRMEHTIDK